MSYPKSLSQSLAPALLQSVTTKAFHLELPLVLQPIATVMPQKIPVSVVALINSGASDNFMDLEFCQKHGIPSQLKKTPEYVQSVDGSPLRSGPVTHETQPLRVLSQNHHQEILSFNLVKSAHFPVILGFPWLQ